MASPLRFGPVEYSVTKEERKSFHPRTKDNQKYYPRTPPKDATKRRMIQLAQVEGVRKCRSDIWYFLRESYASFFSSPFPPLCTSFRFSFWFRLFLFPSPPPPPEIRSSARFDANRRRTAFNRRSFNGRSRPVCARALLRVVCVLCSVCSSLPGPVATSRQLRLWAFVQDLLRGTCGWPRLKWNRWRSSLIGICYHHFVFSLLPFLEKRR